MTLRAASASRLPVVDLANRALKQAWVRAILAEPPIDAPSLIAKAERLERGLLEPGEWTGALELLTADLEQSAALNPLGRSMAHGQLVEILRQRIRAAQWWRRKPDILARPIERPIVILGQMRSGTTFMHRLLACDPRFSFTRLHESLWPLARSADAASVRAGLLRAWLDLCNPALRSVHPTAARAPEEEFGLHAFSLHGAMFEAQWNVPGFARWSEARDLAPVYREFHRLLQTLRWRRDDRSDAIQLLKAPQFMQDLGALLGEFPDSRIVLLVRDPLDVAASSASLVWHQQRVQSGSADPHRIGREWLRKTKLRSERAAAALGRVPSDRLVAVPYEELSADWRRAVHRIYDRFDMNLKPSVLARMAGIASGSAHRDHTYSAQQFGLVEAGLSTVER